MIKFPTFLACSEVQHISDENLEQKKNQLQELDSLRIKDGKKNRLPTFHLQLASLKAPTENITTNEGANEVKPPPRLQPVSIAADDKVLSTPKTEISISSSEDPSYEDSPKQNCHIQDDSISSDDCSRSNFFTFLTIDDESDIGDIRIDLHNATECECIRNGRDAEACNSSPIAESEKVKFSQFKLKEVEKQALNKRKRHFSLFAFGWLSTISTITLAIIGITLSYKTKSSSSFVRLQEKLNLSPQLDTVEHIGISQVTLCYNQTSIDQQVWEASSQALWGNDTYQQLTGCFDFKLTLEEIDDTMWIISLSFQCLALVMGTFSTVLLSLTIYWESINLKPIVMSLLLTYLFQSFSFSFFDSDLCQENGCDFSDGSVFSIWASICWFLCSFSCIRMHIVYESKRKKLDQRRGRALKKLDLQRKYSYVTETTSASDETSS